LQRKNVRFTPLIGNSLEEESQVLYRIIYAPTIKCILQGSSHNDNKLYDISKSTTHLFIQSMRYSKTTARDIVFGSPELGGLSFMNLHMEQGLLYLQLLLKALKES
jgi:hypothetical protein